MDGLGVLEAPSGGWWCPIQVHFFAAIAVITFICQLERLPMAAGDRPGLRSMWTVQVALSNVPRPSKRDQSSTRAVPRRCRLPSAPAGVGLCLPAALPGPGRRTKPESRADGSRCAGHAHRLARSRPRVPDRSGPTAAVRLLCGAHGTLRLHRHLRTRPRHAPTTRLRDDVLELTREIGPTLVRYPGGNFVSTTGGRTASGPATSGPRGSTWPGTRSRPTSSGCTTSCPGPTRSTPSR